MNPQLVIVNSQLVIVSFKLVLFCWLNAHTMSFLCYQYCIIIVVASCEGHIVYIHTLHVLTENLASFIVSFISRKINKNNVFFSIISEWPAGTCMDKSNSLKSAVQPQSANVLLLYIIMQDSQLIPRLIIGSGPGNEVGSLPQRTLLSVCLGHLKELLRGGEGRGGEGKSRLYRGERIERAGGHGKSRKELCIPRYNRDPHIFLYYFLHCGRKTY